MKKVIFFLMLISTIQVNLQAQSWSGSTPGDIYYNNGEVGIGTSNPTSLLSIYKAGGSALYPTATSRGDVLQTLTSSNNGIEIGNAKGSNDRKSWILARHSSTSSYGKYYSTLHLQPDVGDKSVYKGVAIGFPTNNNINFGAHLAVNGNVGIGTMSPSSLLHLEKDDNNASYPSVTSRGDVFQIYQSENNTMEMGVAGASNTRKSWILSRHSDISGTYGMHYATIHLQPSVGDKTQFRGIAVGYAASTQLDVGMHLAVDGKVGIGTLTTGSHQLAVEGSIGAREIQVETGSWSDFVFENDYDLPTLEEVEQHINEKGHLPEIPNEAEVIENGINLGEMNAKLLQKIEELTLYMIEINKEVKTLKTRNAQLEKEVSVLKKQ